MDAQPDRGEIPLADLSTQLVEADPSPEHQVVDDPLAVGHVVDDAVERRLPHPLRFGQLWDGTWASGGRRPPAYFLLHYGLAF